MLMSVGTKIQKIAIHYICCRRAQNIRSTNTRQGSCHAYLLCPCIYDHDKKRTCTLTKEHKNYITQQENHERLWCIPLSNLTQSYRQILSLSISELLFLKKKRNKCKERYYTVVSRPVPCFPQIILKAIMVCRWGTVIILNKEIAQLSY